MNLKIKKREFYKYFSLFVILYIVYYIKADVLPQQLDIYISTQYLTSYDFGFISRGLIATILTSIFDEISLWHIHLVVSIFNIIMILLTSYFCAKVFVNVKDNIRFIVFSIVLFFCVNPAGISFLFIQKNFGRLELFSIIIMLISVIIIIKRNKLVYIMPFLCIVSILIYHTAIFMYLPIVFVLLFYIVIKEKNKRYKWLFIVSFVLSCIFFIYMQCFGKITMFSLDDAILKISKTSLFSPSDEYLRAEYYMEVSGHLKMMDHRMPKILYRLIISLVIYIPVIYCIYYVYIKSFKRAEKKQKLVYLAILVNVLTFIPVFIFAVDYGRWISAMFISQLILILSLVYMKDELILEALEGLQEKLLAKKYYVMAIIALYAMLPRFTHYEVFPLVNNINRIIETISSYFNMLMN